MRYRKQRYAMTCAIIVGFAGFGASAAFAQSAADAGAAKSPEADAEAGASLGDIVVTAQKRSQNLQKTPAAIAVLSSELLTRQGITEVRAVQFSIPSARFSKNQDKAQLFIRGVGIANDNLAVDAAIALNVNDVIIPREGSGGALFDVERIEVLKGPQGTIYGSNAAGGVINVQTIKPANNWDGYVLAEYGNFDAVHIWGAQNIALTDQFQIRIAGDLLSRDGYASNGFNDQRSKAGRLSAAWEPSSRLSVDAWVQYYINRGLGDFAYRQPLRDPDHPRRAPYFRNRLQVQNPSQLDERRRNKNLAAGANIRFELSDDIALTYIPGYVYASNRGHLILDTADDQTLLKSQTYRSQWTHELRVSNVDSSDRLQYLFGLYRYVQNNSDLRTAGTAINVVIPDQGNHNVAIFSQATYALSPAFRVTGGLRYTEDKKDVIGNRFTRAPVPAPIPFDQSFKNTRIDYKIGIDADLSPNSLVYANVQTGYLGGAISFFRLANVPSIVDPEKLTAFQVGTKNMLFDRRLRLNAEAFYYDYRDYQVSLLNAQAGTTAIFNAPKSRVYGAELDMQFNPVPDGTLSVAAAYLHAKFRDFFIPLGQSSTVRSYDFSGFDLPQAPKFTANLGYQHRFLFENDSELLFNVQSQISAGYWHTFSHGVTQCSAVPVAVLSQSQCVNRAQRQKAYTMTNIDLTYRFAKGLELALFVRNLEDSTIIGSSADGRLTATGAVANFAAGELQPPRTYGARLGYRW